jgi:hypothetical protein
MFVLMTWGPIQSIGYTVKENSTAGLLRMLTLYAKDSCCSVSLKMTTGTTQVCVGFSVVNSSNTTF